MICALIIVLNPLEQSVSVAFAKCVRMLVEGQLAGRLSGEVALIMDEPLLLMGRCLPHIVPHVLLNKREVITSYFC